MKINVKKGAIDKTAADAIILTMFQEEKELPADVAAIDARCGGIIGEVIKNGDISGKPSQVSVVYIKGKVPAKRIVLVGLGKRNEINPEKIREAFARAMQSLRNLNVKEAATVIDFSIMPNAKDKLIQAIAEGASLGLYQYNNYKTVGLEDVREIKQLNIVAGEKDYLLIDAEIKKAKIITDAVCMVRDLVSSPANDMTPSIMAINAMEITTRRNISCRILNREKMAEFGMNALLGVAAGSCEEPKFIILEYWGGKKSVAPIVLVGKGLTFDSGGISIKPAEKMDEMKSDMSGGAAVLGALAAAADLKLRQNIIGLIPATENMPSGTALKPGDIVKSYSGKTIEIVNTDAEGRLILADALTYAWKYKPAAIIDLATLTGACIIALGDDVIGMLGNDEGLKRQIAEAAKASGELVWELPLWEMYSEPIKSDIADYKNSGGRAGSTITAAAFLSKFVGDYPWVHLDIAGPAWRNKEKPYIPKGASGVGVRLIIEFLKNYPGK